MDAFLPPDLEYLAINNLGVDEDYQDEREDYHFGNITADEITLLKQKNVY